MEIVEDTFDDGNGEGDEVYDDEVESGRDEVWVEVTDH